MKIFVLFFLLVCLFFMQECQKRLDHKLSLDAYLLKPVQRITKYQLMLKVSFSILYYIVVCLYIEVMTSQLSFIVL